MKFDFEKPGAHEKALRNYFSEFDFPNEIEPLNSPICIMVFVNRSGSSLVCEHMRATGRFTGFGEPLNYELVIQRCKKLGIETFAGYLQWLHRNVYKENSMFGMKASCDQVMMLLRSGAIPRYFNDVRWVFIQRSDIVSQAVSFSIAAQTKKWTSFQSGNEVEPGYYFKDIKNRISAVSQAYASMYALFALLDIQPLRITYEEFVADPELGTKRFADYLGFQGVNVDKSMLRMKSQSGQLNSEYREKFVAEFLASLSLSP
ncbi:Stf0 family sulfotransferase [bacterium]|nr:Stf0 family sulfotransferase [bacterium]